MSTLVSGAIQLEPERFYTVETFAELIDESPARVRELQRWGIIEPAFKTGPIEFRISALFRVTAFRVLQQTCGTTSAIPAKIVKAVGAQIDQICTHEAVYGADLDNALSKAVMRAIWNDEVRDAYTQRVQQAVSK
jgi:hypothetical protein